MNSPDLMQAFFPEELMSYFTITKYELLCNIELKQEVEDKLNDRPRKRLGYETPRNVYLQTIINNGQKVAFMT